MNVTNEKAKGAATPMASGTQSASQSKPKVKPTKKRRVFEALARGLRFHRFDAERNGLHDHCLPSTISAIQSSYQIEVARRTVDVPSYDNSISHPSEYWLETDQLIQARKILGWLP